MSVPLGYEIQTPHLTLRRMNADDAPRVHEIQSNWNVTRMLSKATFPPVLEHLRAWLAPHEAEWTAGTDYRFAANADARVIGCADINDIGAGCGVLGYWFDEAYWGRGLAGEAVAAVVNFGVKQVGLKSLRAGHAYDNPASGRILTKLGFRWINDAESWSQSRQTTITQRKYQLSVS